MIDFLKAFGPILVGIGGITAGILTYLNGRKTNTNVTEDVKIKKGVAFDANLEQIAEYGFKAAEEANKRADRIAEEMRVKIADLQERLDALARDLQESVSALAAVRIEHAREMKEVRAQHQREIDERNRRIYALEDALNKGRQANERQASQVQTDRQRQTVEGDRQTREGERQTREGERQTIEGERLDKIRDDNDVS